MAINSLQKRLHSSVPLFSIEFFPPKSDSAAKQLLDVARELKNYKPDFASITYGAGGSSRSTTLKYARQLSEDYGYCILPHLTCVGHSPKELKGIISEFKDAGINQIMALRGDRQKNVTNFKSRIDELCYANELVHLIHEIYPSCTVGVAGYPETHPEADSAEIDLLHLKLKVDNGAHFITTQLFFDNTVYFDFVERARKANITVPIIPGLMCATSLKQAERFCQMGGTSVPEKLRSLLSTVEDEAAGEVIGLNWLHNQARELLERNAPGIHLYILNQKGPTVALMRRLQTDGFYRN